MAWHYHDDDTIGPAADINLELTGLDIEEGIAGIKRYLIDKTHSNSYTLWVQMGSPQDPDPEQIKKLNTKSELEETGYKRARKIRQNNLLLKDRLDRQAVVLYVIEPKK